ncbi:hypothetical protein FEM48_Zijuj10G0095600 [Ziziphus jujuba var. spinosa]|uniref:Uncharacterized protein n=1 Tax=Ziziphus jujuba var. spinosa TaxID=714518 RepID=A0A978UML7_ZIZJJ|nr:hypothetical protein FEM48_Zijuj10G0095600 [Ziziphus jujuba var. spinosa]
MIKKECVFAFLTGLNNELDEVRGRILGHEVLSSTREMFSEVHREESRRNVMLGKEIRKASVTESKSSDKAQIQHLEIICASAQAEADIEA